MLPIMEIRRFHRHFIFFSDDIIDLTSSLGAVVSLDSNVIDLTGIEDNPEMSSEISTPQQCYLQAKQRIKSESQFNNYCLPEDRPSDPEGTEAACRLCPSLSSDQVKNRNDQGSVSRDETSGSSSTTVNSDMASLDSVRDIGTEQEVSPRTNGEGCLTPAQVYRNSPLKNPLVLTDAHPQKLCLNSNQSPDHATVCSTRKPQSDPMATPTSSLALTNGTFEETFSPRADFTQKLFHPNKAWLYKLRYFRSPPVHHVFFRRMKHDEGDSKNLHLKPLPIPSRRMNIVISTVEERFPQGTLHFLTEFVSPHHYPPTNILCHVIRSILLDGEEQGVMTDAYTLLMKVQELHPATMSTVPWDWSLLTTVMQKKDPHACLLFLQYVVQTLDDDFQLNLRRRSLHKCLAKMMLSCDMRFCNIRDVIVWLMDAIGRSCSETCPDDESDFVVCENQRMVCLLQRMLTIAVEVDKSPTCSSNKIAESMFSYVISIGTRQQREILFSSIESALLRAKVLEVILHHSCEPPPTLQLSMAKIFYFLKHSKLLLEAQGPGGEWQRWDEMLHHMCLLFLSYQRIMLDHLFIPVTDRIDLILQDTQKPLVPHDDITKVEVELHIDIFIGRITLGAEPAPEIQARLGVLRDLLYTAIEQHA
ncbi:SUMO-interacting motif-containing protein 1 isoform X2 [Ascaphus truei]|uniref:SUMO-interacting motif-containing protein 1 isoform X2 n=1 Tax=Ascaphus truei TaxID=8439 RepID=UPI003F5A5F08